MKQRVHHRNIAYRPPIEGPRFKTASFPLCVRFVKRYILPHAKSVIFCIFLLSLNACSVFLIAHYGRIVVDDILVVSAADNDISTASWTPGRISARDRMPAAHALPHRGGASEPERAAQASPRPPSGIRMLTVIFGLYVLTVICLNLGARLAQRIRIRVSQRIVRQIREDMHHKILSLSRQYHQMHTPGRLMARILSDVRMVQQQMMVTVLNAGSQVLTFVVGAVILLVLEWRLALIAFFSIPLFVVSYRRLAGRVRRIHREQRHTNTCLYGLVSQKLDSVRAILAYGRERHEQLSFHRLSSCFLRDRVLEVWLGAGLNRTGMIITSLATVIVFILGTRFVLAGSMTLGKMLYVYGVTANLFAPILMLTQMSVIVTRLLVVLQRLVQVLDEPVQVAEAPGAVDFPSPLRSGISLRHVHFSYVPEAEPVLRDVTLQVPVGEWVCLVGPSGSGKTTLLHLIARLYDPSSGELLLDGIPLHGVKFSSLRRHMTLVPQESQIFSGTIRDNITYGYPEAEPARIAAAAKATECHEFVMDLPVKYETTIGEKGSTLSGGQRQRISMARALLPNPEVLLLDDCTSALDTDTEHRIQETLSRVMAGKTAVVVTQRVSMAMRCHRIYVLNDGIISESGTHEELLALGGFYSRLYDQQTE